MLDFCTDEPLALFPTFFVFLRIGSSFAKFPHPFLHHPFFSFFSFFCCAHQRSLHFIRASYDIVFCATEVPTPILSLPFSFVARMWTFASFKTALRNRHPPSPPSPPLIEVSQALPPPTPPPLSNRPPRKRAPTCMCASFKPGQPLPKPSVFDFFLSSFPPSFGRREPRPNFCLTSFTRRGNFSEVANFLI